MSKRLHYVVGDIHGCLTELLELEAKVAAHAAKRGATAHVVSTGDLVDRGPDAAGVVRHLRLGVEAATHSVILGNHEQILLEILNEFAPAQLADAGVEPPHFLRDYRQRHRESGMATRLLPIDDYLLMRRLQWSAEGGSTTLRSYGCLSTDPRDWRVPPEDVRFLASRPFLWENEAAVVTHGLADTESVAAARAFQAGEGPAPTPAQTMTLIWGRTLPKARIDPLRWHVSGHNAAPRVRLRRRLGCAQVDSGCVFGYKLSAFCVETGDTLSVKSRKD